MQFNLAYTQPQFFSSLSDVLHNDVSAISFRASHRPVSSPLVNIGDNMNFHPTAIATRGKTTSMQSPCRIIRSVRCVSFVMLNIFSVCAVTALKMAAKNPASGASGAKKFGIIATNDTCECGPCRHE